MRFNSGLGEFELTVERVEIRDNNYVLVGTMGVWEAETTMEPEELIGLYLKSARPKITLYFLRLPFILIKRRFSRRKGGSPASAVPQ
jgi:hypothetical protein